MPVQKAAESSTSVKKVAPAFEPGGQVRQLESVALEVRRLREQEGLNIAEIGEKLQVSYDVMNQLILHSYKSVMNTPVVFEAQEKIRLGLG
jgi:predicted DNA-binding protein (UPF0251 family)